MFERFDAQARGVIVHAQQEAMHLHHNHIGTEHLLLGLIKESEGIAAQALRAMSVNLDVVRAQIGEILGEGMRDTSGHIPFTPRAKTVLMFALREALQRGHNYIGTEHILLGLIREGDGVGAQVVIRMGGDLKLLRRQVNQLLRERGPEVARAETASTDTASTQTYRVGTATRAGAGPSAWRLRPTELMSALRAIEARLAAIERHLGIEPDLGTARESEPDPGAGSGDPGESGDAPDG
jgi:ATP-dependent Clp protease ATP-binding subunit ClpC